MKYYLGIDIGSVNTKLALINESGDIVALDNEKVISSHWSAVSSLIKRLSARFNLQNITSAAASGSGRHIIPGDLNWSEYSSPLSIACGLLHFHPDAMTIIQIGGQTSLVIELEDGLKKPWKVASNPLCAAGTGRFLEQQAYRIGISLDDFARIALSDNTTPPRIAARCSVFAKSDLIHLQQKGVPLSSMLNALSESVARMVLSLKKGDFAEPVYLVGGVAANAAILRSLNKALCDRNKHPTSVVIPQNHLYIEAIGAALLSRESNKASTVTMPEEAGSREQFFTMPPLERVAQKDGLKPPNIERPFLGFLGVDVGSTSTKAVIMDESGREVVAKNYLMTAGKPLEAVKEVFRNLLKDISDKAAIGGAGVTGSGRYLVGSFIGADLIKNEITAQTRAAMDIDPGADIIEIGGQDSKLVIKRNGVVVDYQMNKACAAGTGSFIDELAEMLSISVKNGEFADLAFKAPRTIDLGTRCAAFMGQAVASAQQQGVPVEEITASLANSIANNYLSKVVGTRKLGQKIILTGAVFYNNAVVSAFQRALEGKKLIVAEHKEVSGAIGAALLAREDNVSRESRFKGFEKVINTPYKLSTFVCRKCDNNCTISRMQLPGEKPTFYGSRCDLFDSTRSAAKLETLFDERENLLFKDYRENSGKGPLIGIPRSLMIYDYAPLLIGFLNALGSRVVFSSKTNNQVIEQSAELSYADSCFPVKLMHGHAANLKEADFILYPCFIRMGRKEGDENQKYTCPLVQASPFIIRQTLNLDKRILIPIIDFSKGDDEAIRNLSDIAVKLGFSQKEGVAAAIAGIQSQSQFETSLIEAGGRALEQLRQNKQLGVVIFARSYMSQDAGANLGIAEKLAQLGVVPIPLDYLPLSGINVKQYSDRPYWISESKHIAGAAITASDPNLYGLVLTNFGCGPNSFIINMVEDIMGGKPLGQLEIDEHAAEAGIVTRLEAFVDTIKGFAASTKTYDAAALHKTIYRAAQTSVDSRKVVLIPKMCEHVEAIAASMEAFGVKAIVLPEPDEENILYSSMITSGKECLPYRVTLGDFMKYYYHNGQDKTIPENIEGFMAGSFGPCRLGKYALEQNRILKEIGFNLPIRTSVSNNAYADLNLGSKWERLAWKGVVAIDFLEKLLWRSRPYEKSKGEADALFKEFISLIAKRIGNKQTLNDLLKEATIKFKSLIDNDLPRRPIVGINGEIFLRSNKFSNCNLVRVCEEAGLEVVVSPMSEWIKYTSFRNVEDAIRERKLGKLIRGFIRRQVQRHDEQLIARNFVDLLHTEEPATEKTLSYSKRVLSPRCGSEAVLSLGSGIEWLENPEFAGVISVMPHGCMPGGIVAAMSEGLSTICGKPWINVTYDGFLETNNLERINNFAEIIRYCNRGEGK